MRALVLQTGGRARAVVRPESKVMPLFSRKIPYDRKRLLEQAELATSKKRWRRAVAHYRQILAAEPRSYEIHYRIAPLLARRGRRFDAWESFRIAAEAPEIADDPRRTAALYASAVKALPRCVDAWRELSRAKLRCQESDAALATLLEGRKHFRKRRSACKAIVLLRDALELAPWQSEIVLDLTRQLFRSGQSAEALFLLEELDRRSRGGEERREIRRLVWRIDPTLGNTWRWLRSDSADTGSRKVGLSGPRRRRA